MAITQAFCSTYKGDLLSGRARLVTGQANHRAALYISSATLAATTAAYITSGEVASGGGYTDKGELIVIASSMPSSSTSQTTAYTDFDDTTWGTSTITARGALVYDDAATTPTVDAALIVLDFTSDKSSSSGDFTIQWPAAATGTAIIRIA